MRTPYNKLIELIAECGGVQAKAARKLDVSRAYISLLVRHKAPMTREIADKLGFDLVATETWVERV